jgi:hypothetical protein
MIDGNAFNGVGISGVSWAFRAWTFPAAALHAPAAVAHAAAYAPMPRKRRTAAATLASVNRGTF